MSYRRWKHSLMSTLFLQIGIWVRNIAIRFYVKEMIKNATSLVPLYVTAGLLFLVGVVILVPLSKLRDGIEPIPEKSVAN